MKKDAEVHAEEDKKKKEAVETKNMADTLIFTTEKALKEAGDKITAEEKKPVEEKIEALKGIKDGEDVAAIKKATEELSQEAQKIGQKLYQAAQPGSTAGDANSTAGGGEQKKDGEPEKPKDAETEKPKDAEPARDASQSDAGGTEKPEDKK